MYIVGLGCTAQVGKDTAASYLEKKHPGKVKRVAFADKLKQMAMDVFGLTQEQCYGAVEVKEAVDPRYGLSPREIMQGIGEKMREIYPAIWVDTVFNSTIPELEQQGYNCVVISDVRYPNEGDKVHEHGGFVVRIDRKSGGTSVGASHSSETAMANYEDFDFIVENNGTFEGFFEQIDRMMEEIGYGREEVGN